MSFKTRVLRTCSLWTAVRARIFGLGASILLASCASYGPAQPSAGGTVFSTYGSGPQTYITHGYRGPPEKATAERRVTANGVVVFTHPGQCKFSLAWEANRIQFLNTIIIVDGKEYASPIFVMDQPALTPYRQFLLADMVWLLNSASSNYCAPLLNPETANENTKQYYEYKEEAARIISLVMIEYALRSKQAQTEEEAAQLHSEMNAWGNYIEEWNTIANRQPVEEIEGRAPSTLKRFVGPELPAPK